MRRHLILAALLCSGCLFVAAAHAQSAAYAMPAHDPAQHLADKSLACLRRGEDAEDRGAKLAAYREGLELARQAVAANDHNADAHFAVFGNEGRLMLLEGGGANPINLMKANAELERTLALNPNHSDALAAKGGLYRQLPWVLGGNLEKAESLLARAIELNPNAVGARIELAQIYRDTGSPERSLPLLETAAQIAERQGKQRQLAEAQQLLAELHTQQ